MTLQVNPRQIQLEKIWIFKDSTPVQSYDFTAIGFDNALGDASSGDIILIPAGSILGDHTIPSGVEVKGIGVNSILSGNVTNNGILSMISVSGSLTGTGTENLVLTTYGMFFDNNNLLYSNKSIEVGASGVTPPFFVSSCALVVNFNADLLDGLHASQITGSGGGSGVTSLSALNDVDITSPVNSQVLTYSSGSWINLAPIGASNLSDLADVSLTIPADNDILIYKSGVWVNEPKEVGASRLVDLDDVNILTPSASQVLTYSSGSWINANSTSGCSFNIVDTYWDCDVPPVISGSYDDEFSGSSIDTGIWTEFDPNSILTVSVNDGFLEFAQSGRAGQNLNGIYRSFDNSASATIILKVSKGANQSSETYSWGIHLYANAGNSASPMYRYSMLMDGTAHLRIQLNRYNNYDTPAAGGEVFNINDIFGEVTTLYLKITYDPFISASGTIYCSFSSDGIGWDRISTSHNLQFRINHIGPGIARTTTGSVIYGKYDFIRSGSTIQDVNTKLSGRLVRRIY